MTSSSNHRARNSNGVPASYNHNEPHRTRPTVAAKLLHTMKPMSLRPFLPRPAIRRRLGATRRYAIQAPGAPMQVFSRNTKYLQKERAASDVETSRKVDYLKDEVASRLCERVLVRMPFCTPMASRRRGYLLIIPLPGHQTPIPTCP